MGVWLKANPQFDNFATKFENNEIDGYSLLNLSEEDMVEALGMLEAPLREQLKRAIKKLIVFWIRYGKNCERFFREQADSLYFDEISLVEQSNLGRNSGGIDETAGSFSIVKMLGEEPGKPKIIKGWYQNNESEVWFKQDDQFD